MSFNLQEGSDPGSHLRSPVLQYLNIAGTLDLLSILFRWGLDWLYEGLVALLGSPASCTSRLLTFLTGGPNQQHCLRHSRVPVIGRGLCWRIAASATQRRHPKRRQGRRQREPTPSPSAQ